MVAHGHAEGERGVGGGHSSLVDGEQVVKVGDVTLGHWSEKSVPEEKSGVLDVDSEVARVGEHLPDQPHMSVQLGQKHLSPQVLQIDFIGQVVRVQRVRG